MKAQKMFIFYPGSGTGPTLVAFEGVGEEGARPGVLVPILSSNADRNYTEITFSVPVEITIGGES